MFSGDLPTLKEVVMMLPGLLMGFTFHEFAHAWVATRFGDDLPRLQGRVTLNPIAHLDPIGTILLIVAGFGWAKPVQVNTSRLKPRMWGDIAVSLAGVTMNFILAIIFFAAHLVVARRLLFDVYSPELEMTLSYVWGFNLVLVAFNLIPVPPLDGFHVLKYLFPQSMSHIVATLYRVGPFLLLLLVMTRTFRQLMEPLLGGLQKLLFSIVVPLVNALFGGGIA